MSKPEFVYVTYIETTPEKLWEALIDRASSPGDTGSAPRSGRTGRSARHSRWSRSTARPPIPARSSESRSAAPPVLHASSTSSTKTMRASPLSTRRLHDRTVSAIVVQLTVTHDGFVEGGKHARRRLQRAGRRSCPSLKSLLETGKPLAIPRAALGKKNSSHEDHRRTRPDMNIDSSSRRSSTRSTSPPRPRRCGRR